MVILHTIWLTIVAALGWFLMLLSAPSPYTSQARVRHFRAVETIVGFRLVTSNYLSGFFIALTLVRLIDEPQGALTAARWTFTILSLLLSFLMLGSEQALKPTVSAPLGPIAAWLGMTAGWHVSACG